nr:MULTISPECIES: ferredoxin [Mesorhizobium]
MTMAVPSHGKTMEVSAMRIIVHNAKCQGHARCSAQAPSIFTLDDEGYVLRGDINVAQGDELLASRAVRSCPERALEVDSSSAARFDPAAIQPKAGEA